MSAIGIVSLLIIGGLVGVISTVLVRDILEYGEERERYAKATREMAAYAKVWVENTGKYTEKRVNDLSTKDIYRASDVAELQAEADKLEKRVRDLEEFRESLKGSVFVTGGKE